MTEYQIRLDRNACDGIFACLVRDSRFAEAADGLATIDGTETRQEGSDLVATFDDEDIADAKQAAAACPVDAITVSTELREAVTPGKSTGGSDE